MNEKAREAMAEISIVSRQLIQRDGSTRQDVVLVAAALMHAAEVIFLSIGGPSLAVAQFMEAVERNRASFQ